MKMNYNRKYNLSKKTLKKYHKCHREVNQSYSKK